MPRPPLIRAVPILALAILDTHAQNYLPLDFSQNVQATNAIYPNNSTLGPDYFSGLVFDFLNVTTQDGQSIDARVSVLGSAGAYEFVGWIPDYNEDAGQPENDLGVYLRHTHDFSEPTGGIAWTITFYQGGGAFTDTAVLSNLAFLIYDHDGEPGQSESIRLYESDGLAGYRIADGSGIHSHDEDGTWRFDAGGENLSETNADGSFIAYYQNTSSIRFDMFGTTMPTNPVGNNGMFAGFDGDLSLIGGDTANYGALVTIPEPSSSALVAASLAMTLLRRTRPRR